VLFEAVTVELKSVRRSSSMVGGRESWCTRSHKSSARSDRRPGGQGDFSMTLPRGHHVVQILLAYLHVSKSCCGTVGTVLERSGSAGRGVSRGRLSRRSWPSMHLFENSDERLCVLLHSAKITAKPRHDGPHGVVSCASGSRLFQKRYHRSKPPMLWHLSRPLVLMTGASGGAHGDPECGLK
jgi:hypothetical protein